VSGGGPDHPTARGRGSGGMLPIAQYTNTADPTNSHSPDGATFDALVSFHFIVIRRLS